uniref:Enoyl-CoA hydratase n=1 Tax=Pyxidicoccus sp. MCy9557 TaxID=2012863 RepID=A0A1Z2TJM4_9BACT|nr:enoyl-CoA hydratase [Pyxidicoccus sp. MCy9557]
MSDVVKLAVDSRGIALVTMEERVHKNTFSRPLVDGLRATFAELGRRTDVRVVVLTGYENYFCCGGNKEELLAMNEGRMRFTDMDFYDLLLRCELPVVSAMQGHGIGGGLVFGCTADVIVMANEAIYCTKFMRYGFTPGFGATCIIPKKFGEVLASEMLFTASNYSGGQLRERGAPMRIVPKKDVLAVAMGMAAELADKPLVSLKLLKRQLTAKLREELRDAVSAELRMQETTFHLPEVRERIEGLF